MPTTWIEPAIISDIIGIFREPVQPRDGVGDDVQNVIVLATGRIGGQTNMRLLTEDERAGQHGDSARAFRRPRRCWSWRSTSAPYLSLRNSEDNEITDLADP